LNNGFDFDIYDPPILPDLGQYRLGEDNKLNLRNSIISFPNPATDKLNFQYSLDKEYTDLSIKIYNANGSQMSSIQIPNGQNGFEEWDASFLLPGIYFYSICSKNHTLNTSKLVIVK